MPSRTQARQRSGSSGSNRSDDTRVIVADPKKVVGDFEAMVERRRSRLANLLGGDERLVDRFITVALSAVTKPSSGLLEAVQDDPLAVMNAIRDAAQMGLEPAGPLGEGAIVAYRDGPNGPKVAQFQPMVRGLRKLALASPGVSVVNVGIRHAKDEFEYREGSDPFIRHVPWIDDDDPGDVMGAYAYARINGEVVVLYMNLAEIRKRQNVARTQKVWQAWPEEMMKKTVLRRLISEKLPMTAKLGFALAVEEADLDRPAVSTVDRPALAAPGSRTRARHSASEDAETTQDGAGAPGNGSQGSDTRKDGDDAQRGSTAATDDAGTSDGDATDICGKPGLHEGSVCVREPHDDPPHRDKDGEEWL